MTITSGHAANQNLNEEVGAIVHQMMFRRRITQGQLAAALGLGQSTVSAKIRGKIGISIEDLYAIAGVLGVDPGDLLPRLDSNQQPSGYPLSLVRGGSSADEQPEGRIWWPDATQPAPRPPARLVLVEAVAS